MPRFVLLYHHCPPGYERPSHWDFMLETGDVLRTWALEQLPTGWELARARTAVVDPNCPAIGTSNEVVAQQLGDHRRDYLESEGPLSGGRGTVARVAAGSYESECEIVAESRLWLTGEVISGHVQLRRTDSDARWMVRIQHQLPIIEE